MSILHPPKIYIFIDSGCEPGYLWIVSKELPRCQHAAQQQRRIDRRDFAVPFSLASPCVHPVIEPPVNPRSPVCEEAKGHRCTIASCLSLDPTASGRDAQRRKSESCSGDACHVPMSLVVWRSVCSYAIQH